MANIVILLVVVTIVAVISLQNATPVVLTFLFWKVNTSLAVVIFCAILTGMIITAVVLLSAYVKRIAKKKSPKTGPVP